MNASTRRSLKVSFALGVAATIVPAWALWVVHDWKQAGAEVASSFRAEEPLPGGAPFIWRWNQTGYRAWYTSRAPGEPSQRALTDLMPRWTGMWGARWLGKPDGERSMVAYGWPFPALQVRSDQHPREWGRRPGLPVRPVWWGLVSNVAIFGGGYWLVTFVPPRLVRPSRRSRGLCPRCGYDLLGDFDSGCPECGWGRSHLLDSPGGRERD